MMFTLVRTSTGEVKQQGISFLLIDLQSPGITIRPITLLNNAAEICEVFLDGVRVPVTNRVGTKAKAGPTRRGCSNTSAAPSATSTARAPHLLAFANSRQSKASARARFRGSIFSEKLARL